MVLVPIFCSLFLPTTANAQTSALGHESEITSPTTLGFPYSGSSPRMLTTQYKFSHNAEFTNATETGTGHITLTATTSPLRIDFVDPVHVASIRVENGPVFDSPPNTSEAPRFFRFRAYSTAGALLEEFRWRTAQSGARTGFYGVHSTSLIGRIEIDVLDGGQLSLDDLITSGSTSLTSTTHPEGCAVPWSGTGLWHVTITGLDSDGDGSSDATAGWSRCGDRWNYTHSGTGTNSTFWAANNAGLGHYQPNAASTSHLCSVAVQPHDPACIDPDVPDLNSDGLIDETEVEASWTSSSHWSHFHFQSFYETEETGTRPAPSSPNLWTCGCGTNNGGSTAHPCPLDHSQSPTDDSRTLWYSVDNGTTWRPAWWYKDTNGGRRHRGTPGTWDMHHGHPFMDSWRVDFDSDGSCDDLDWDFMYEHYDPSACPTSASTTSCSKSWAHDGYYRYAVTLRYRFTFKSDGDGFANCTNSNGTAPTCQGWWIDDVAFSPYLESGCVSCTATGTRYFDFE